MLAERNVDSTRGGELGEGRIECDRIGGEQEGLARQLGEGRGIGGDHAHAMRDGAASGPAGPCPRVEDRVARPAEGVQLSVELVIGRRRKVTLEECEPGEAAWKNDVIQSLPFGLGQSGS